MKQILTLIVGALVVSSSVVAQDESAVRLAPGDAVVTATAGGEVAAPDEEKTSISITSLDLSPVYPCAQGEFDKQFDPELGTAGVEWKNVRFNGYLDFIDVFGQRDWVVVYARVTLDAEKACKINLSLGSDDGIVVIAGGKRVFSNDTYRPCEAAQEEVELDLAKGSNAVLFRVNNGGGGWAINIAAAVVGKTRVTQGAVRVEAKKDDAVKVEAAPANQPKAE